MSIASLSPLIAAAGTPIAQAKGTELERIAHETAAHLARRAGQSNAERAAGVSSPAGEDSLTDDRAADGRHPWEIAEKRDASDPAVAARKPGDPQSGREAVGGRLDITA